MSNPIKPTIGRMVYYVMPFESDRAGEIRAATIVRVIDELRVNLLVHLDGPNDQGEDAWRGTISHFQLNEGETPIYNTWHWMPFQIGQANNLIGKEKI